MPSLTSFRLMEACRKPGCPICRLEQQGVERYLDSQFYENVNSPAWRAQLRLSHGFCHEHAWLGMGKRLGDALGFSIIYHDVVNNLLKSLDDPARATSPAQSRVPSLRDRVARVLATLKPKKRCPACEHRDVLRHDLLSVLVKETAAREMGEALRSSDGLCLPHLRQVLESLSDNSVYEILLAIHREKLENLKNELAEFIRKNDYRQSGEGFGSEGNAWLRAISLVAGSRKDP